MDRKVGDEADNILAVLEGINKDVLFLSKTPQFKGLFAPKKVAK